MSPSRFYGRGLGLKSGYVMQIFESCVRHIQFQAVLFRFVNTPTLGNVQRNNLTRSRFPFEFLFEYTGFGPVFCGYTHVIL